MSELREPQFDGEVMKIPASAAPAPTRTESNGQAFGLIIALLFVALVLILGGLFLWYRDVLIGPALIVPSNIPPITENSGTGELPDVPEIESFAPLSTSTDLSAISADLNNTNPTSTEADIAAIEAEMDRITATAINPASSATSTTP